MTLYRLEYFKPSGKWYADSSIEMVGDFWSAISRIRELHSRNDLPGVAHSSEFHVYVRGKGGISQLVLCGTGGHCDT